MELNVMSSKILGSGAKNRTETVQVAAQFNLQKKILQRRIEAITDLITITRIF
jgi:hypothetical protein